uniref:Uncharacterized protein n=1 Tax=Sphingobacterium sp. (strain 21) TaxID=743722 RepID=F4CCQ0_SPHS2
MNKKGTASFEAAPTIDYLSMVFLVIIVISQC